MEDKIAKTLKSCLPWLLCLLFDALALGGAWLWGYHRGRASVKAARVDTVLVDRPVAVRENPVGVATVPVRVVSLGKHGEIPSDVPSEIPSDGITVGVADSAFPALHDSVGDTLRAAVPITQKEYRDSDYAAWVSGFMPRLDSIRIYRKAVVRTQAVTRRNAFSVGLTGGLGYGVLTRKPDVWVGVGVTWRIAR